MNLRKMLNPMTFVRLCLLLLGLSVLFAGTAPVAIAADKKDDGPVIAVLDVQRVMREAAAAKSIRDAVEAKRKVFEAEIETERKSLKDEDEKLRQQQAVLAPEALNQRRRELERRYAELRRRADQASAVLNKAVNTAMRTLRQEMATVLAGLMKEKDINITLARSAVLVFDEQLNVTADVLARLDKRLPKIEVTVEQPAGN
jgi:Skp family chaperone for outer membrane proteins